MVHFKCTMVGAVLQFLFIKTQAKIDCENISWSRDERHNLCLIFAFYSTRTEAICHPCHPMS